MGSCVSDFWQEMILDFEKCHDRSEDEKPPKAWEEESLSSAVNRGRRMPRESICTNSKAFDSGRFFERTGSLIKYVLRDSRQIVR